MNKLIKGAIACAAGIALLLGGAGTFALWNSTAAAGAGHIKSGTLSLAAPTAGAWANITTGAPVAIADIDDFRMVPGNVLQFTQTLAVNATGDDLTADLTYDPLSITGTAALKSALVPTLTATASGAGIVSAGTNAFTVTPSASSATVTVVLTVELPESVTTGQGGTVNLGGLTFTLTQRAIA
jgi:alternate signal-mediated exported protein